MCILAKGVWGSSLMLLGLLGKRRLTVKLLRIDSGARATESPVFRHNTTEHLLLHLRCSWVGLRLCFVVVFKLIFE